MFFYGDLVLTNATIFTNKAKFIVKPHVLIGEGLRVSTGNHYMTIGKFCTEISGKDKPIEFDKDVIVESDVWIGRNVTLLSGVTIGRGASVAAGAVVNRDVLPYSLFAGVPSQFKKFKWTIDEIIEHEKSLYPIEERYTIEQLEILFEKHNF